MHVSCLPHILLGLPHIRVEIFAGFLWVDSEPFIVVVKSKFAINYVSERIFIEIKHNFIRLATNL
jgi:hypothetical protein